MTITYSLEDAQALLPEAKQRLAEASRVLTDLRRVLQHLRDGQAMVTSSDAATLETTFDQTMAWFTQRSIQVKGLDPALLDFPARAIRDGREIDVLLCWRDDEDAIAYYHPLASGYRGREPIAMLDCIRD